MKIFLLDMPRKLKLSRQNKRWSVNEEKILVNLKLESNLKFAQICNFLLRSENALKLRFSSVIDSIDWNSLQPTTDPQPNLQSVDDLASALIIEGGTPFDVAIAFPAYFVGNFEGIERLFETINKKPWRRFK